MTPDMNGLPIAGGAAVALILYAGVSLFVTGPLVGERTIEKSGWTQTCAHHVRHQAERTQPSGLALPKLDCATILGNGFGRQGAAFCELYGGGLPFAIIGEWQRQQGELRQSRIDHAGSSATTRCDCAVNTVLEDRRTALAVYAGSFRLITPKPVKTLPSELRLALGAPSCAMKE